MFEECFGEGPFIFRINENGTGPQLLTQVCLERGWREYNSDTNDDNNWNLWWRTSGFSSNHHKNIYGWQYLNHIPKGSTICRKDNLIRYLRSMRKIYGAIYDFSPHGFNLPLEYTKLAAECSRSRPASRTEEDCLLKLVPDDRPIWICKPVAQSQGRGIFLFKKLSELNYDSNTIVQRYVDKPLLIGGYKFDLRLYVCVPSYHPLTVYMYREGLARFGTDKFSLNDLKNPFRHLTNSSINKLGPGYLEMKDRVGSGSKWTLRQLRRYFQQASIPDWLVWQRITSVIVLTILSQVQQIPPSFNCFEFYGFDVLIDSALRPWLLEVNLSPALSNDCDVDEMVKKPMLHDMFDLLGLPLYNTGLSLFEIWLGESTDKENDNGQSAKKPSTSASNAAGRWRRRYKRMSAQPRQPSSRASTGRAKPRSTTASGQKTVLKLHKSDITAPTLPCVIPGAKTLSDENKKSESRRAWGNGRNWHVPKPREGGWVRIWPMDSGDKIDRNNNVVSKHVTNGTVKTMVNKIIRCNKTAKDLAKKHPAASESQLSEFLQQEMDMDGDIWIPPV